MRIPAGGKAGRVDRLLEAAGLNTVCRSARCPNQSECFGRGTATFMIMGDACTRRCAFCAVGGGVPAPLDIGEAQRLAAAAARLHLKHVVITSVTRDDLPDGGASAFARSIKAVRKALPRATIEVLTPDFRGVCSDIATVLRAHPDVFNHNLETVRRLQRRIRPDADYRRSLRVLSVAAGWDPAVVVKSGLMVGLGETDREIEEAMRDLRDAGCEALTIGQYLAPSPRHAPVARFVAPEAFGDFARRATAMGFSAVASGPLVRSSYRAGELIARDG